MEILFASEWKKTNKQVVSWYETNKLQRITESLQSKKEKRKKDIENNIYQLKIDSINKIIHKLQNKITELTDIQKQYFELIYQNYINIQQY